MSQKYKLQIIPVCFGEILIPWTEPTDNLPLFKKTYDALKNLERIGFALYIYRDNETISEEELEKDCSSNYLPAADFC